MKFSIRQSELNEALSNLIRITEKPFENVKIEKLSNDRLLLTTYNQNISMQIKVNAVDVQGDNILYNCKNLYTLVSKLNDTINFDDGKITQGKSKFNMLIFPDNIPVIKNIDGEVIKVNAKELTSKIGYVTHATANAGNIMDGISISENELCASDGNVLALEKLENKVLKGQIVIPKKLADELNKCFDDEDLEVISDEISISILGCDIQIQSKLLNGIFPLYNKFIPQDLKENVIIDKSQLLKKLDLVLSLQTEKDKEINFEFGDNEIILSSGNELNGGKTSLDVDYIGEKSSFIFGSDIFVNSIKNSYGEVLIFNFNVGDNKIMVKSDDNSLKLIMGRIKKPINKI